MNGNPNIPVASGDRLKIRRDWYNQVTRRANAAKLGTPDTRNATLPDGLLLVQNNTGADLNAGEVMGIASVAFTAAQNLNEYLYNFSFKGHAIVSGDSGRFVVAYGPIANSAVGLCYAFGVCPVRVNVSSGTDQWAEIVSGQKYLKTGVTGSAQILDLAATTDGDGNRWAQVRLPAGSAAGPTVSYGKLTADWSSANNTVSASGCDAGGTLISPTVSLTLTLFQHAGAYYSDLKSGNVVAYLSTGPSSGYMINPQPLPVPTSQYQVIIAGGGSGPPYRADWVRAH